MVNKRQLRIVLKFGSNLITTNNTVLNYNVIDNLVSQKEIDGVMIGPYDISGSLGIPGKSNDPKVKSAFVTS